MASPKRHHKKTHKMRTKKHYRHHKPLLSKHKMAFHQNQKLKTKKHYRHHKPLLTKHKMVGGGDLVNPNTCPGCRSDNTTAIGSYLINTPHPDWPASWKDFSTNFKMPQSGGSCGTCGNCGCTQPPLLFQRGGKKRGKKGGSSCGSPSLMQTGGSSCGSPSLMQTGGSSCGSPSLTGSPGLIQNGGQTACGSPPSLGILKGPNGLMQQGGSVCVGNPSLTGSSNYTLYGGRKTRKTQKGGGFFDWAKPFWNPQEPGAGGYNDGYKVLAPSKWGVGPSGPIGAPRSTAGDDPIPKHQPWSAEFRSDPHIYQKGGKSKKNKRGGGFFDDIINLGRQGAYTVGSTVNTLNGYPKETNPLPLNQFPRGLGSTGDVPKASMLNIPDIYKQGTRMAGNI